MSQKFGQSTRAKNFSCDNHSYAERSRFVQEYIMSPSKHINGSNCTKDINRGDVINHESKLRSFSSRDNTCNLGLEQKRWFEQQKLREQRTTNPEMCNSES